MFMAGILASHAGLRLSLALVFHVMPSSKGWNARSCVVALALVLFLGCFDSHPVWRSQRLPSGKTIKVTFFNLVWGAEHDERIPSQDCFALEYVTSVPVTDAQARDREAREVFELIRPTSELWGFSTATVTAFRTVERKGNYNLFVFTRGKNGQWSFTRSPMSFNPH
jgi:hypothetical protein